MALVVSKAKKAPATIKSVIPAHIDSSEVLDLGSGLCRGPKWQANNWPKDEGINLVLNLSSRVLSRLKNSSKVGFMFSMILRLPFDQNRVQSYLV